MRDDGSEVWHVYRRYLRRVCAGLGKGMVFMLWGDEVVIDIDMVLVWYMPKTGDIRRARDEEMGVNIVAVV